MTSIIPLKPFGFDPATLKQSYEENESGSTVIVAKAGDCFTNGGITFSKSSADIFTSVLDAVLFTKTLGMVLQSLDQAVYVRDFFDRDPLPGLGDQFKRDYSDHCQATSTFASYWYHGSSYVVGVWDLESIFGGDLEKHVQVVKQLSEKKVQDKHNPLMSVIREYLLGGRMMEVPNDPMMIIPLASYVCPVVRVFLPQCAERNKNYLTRKTFVDGKFYFSKPKDLKFRDRNIDIVTRPCILGGICNGESNNQIFANRNPDYYLGRARGVAIGNNILDKVSP